MPTHAELAIIKTCRKQVLDHVKDNHQMQEVMDIKKGMLRSTTTTASYTKTGALVKFGNWGHNWHLPALAIVLNTDIVAFLILSRYQHLLLLSPLCHARGRKALSLVHAEIVHAVRDAFG